jgi:hypothetical protein
MNKRRKLAGCELETETDENLKQSSAEKKSSKNNDSRRCRSGMGQAALSGRTPAPVWIRTRNEKERK